VDKFSNILSILDVVDEFTISEMPAPPTDGQSVGMGVQLQLVSLWDRSERGMPEGRWWTRIAFEGPDGSNIGTSQALSGSLEGATVRQRLIYEVPVLPYRGVGVYHVVVGWSREEAGGYQEVARVPLEIKAKAAASQHEAAEPPSKAKPRVSRPSAKKRAR
jgi:hypothetical protein